MHRVVLEATCAAIAGCGKARQPESAKTVAAFEVPLPSEKHRDEFLSVLPFANGSSGSVNAKGLARRLVLQNLVALVTEPNPLIQQTVPLALQFAHGPALLETVELVKSAPSEIIGP